MKNQTEGYVLLPKHQLKAIRDWTAHHETAHSCLVRYATLEDCLLVDNAPIERRDTLQARVCTKLSDCFVGFVFAVTQAIGSQGIQFPKCRALTGEDFKAITQSTRPIRSERPIRNTEFRWSKRLSRVRKAVREFSKDTHADY